MNTNKFSTVMPEFFGVSQVFLACPDTDTDNDTDSTNFPIYLNLSEFPRYLWLVWGYLSLISRLYMYLPSVRGYIYRLFFEGGGVGFFIKL